MSFLFLRWDVNSLEGSDSVFRNKLHRAKLNMNIQFLPLRNWLDFPISKSDYWSYEILAAHMNSKTSKHFREFFWEQAVQSGFLLKKHGLLQTCPAFRGNIYIQKPCLCVLDITFRSELFELRIFKSEKLGGVFEVTVFCRFLFCWFSHSFAFFRKRSMEITGVFQLPAFETPSCHCDTFLCFGGTWSPWPAFGWMRLDWKGEVFLKFGHNHVFLKRKFTKTYGFATQNAWFVLVWSFRNCVPVDI